MFQCLFSHCVICSFLLFILQSYVNHSIYLQATLDLSSNTACICKSVIVQYILLCLSNFPAFESCSIQNIQRLRCRCLSPVAFIESANGALRPLWNPAGLVQHWSKVPQASEPDQSQVQSSQTREQPGWFKNMNQLYRLNTGIITLFFIFSIPIDRSQICGQ